MDLSGVNDVCPSLNERRYFEDEDDDSESDYSIDREINGDSEDSWKSQSCDSESADSSHNGGDENARK